MADARVIAADPFALMMNPEAVLQAVEESTRLRHLQRRVYRPLDRPLIPTKNGEAASVDAFDREIDCGDDTAEE